MESQLKQIREDLEKGVELTSFYAILKYNCYRLSARIYDLRHGKNPMNIRTKMKRTLTGKNIAVYSLVK